MEHRNTHGVDPVVEEKAHSSQVEDYNGTRYSDEKKGGGAQVGIFDASQVDEETAEKEAKGLGIEATGQDLADAEEQVANMSLERCKAIMHEIRKMHQYDQNFPAHTLDNINDLLDNPDVSAHPEKHSALIYAMKLEAALVTGNSPYAEVRAVVDPTDDPSMPSLTFRVWFIGIIFSAAGAFVNQLFDLRNPPIIVTSDVAQLLAYPLGKAMQKWLPTRQFTTFGRRWSFNPGPFNKKEHMLITIMCSLAFSTPYTANIIFVQALPMYFNQPFARNFGYQILNTMASNFVGYGLAGLCRRFLVYPSYCIWPTSLSTLALNKAFHSDDSSAVPGPFGKLYTWSRLKFFFIMFAAMFVYFWFPGFLFSALQVFNWMTWIAPQNQTLAAITGYRTGLGINPIPTFDWSWIVNVPLITPLFSIVNQFIGLCIAGIMILGVYYTNSWYTGYLPINTNKTYDNQGKLFNVSKIIDAHAKMDNAKFQTYSEPWMAAGNLTIYFWFFAVYTATLSYTFLYHRHEIAIGFRSSWREFRKFLRLKKKDEVEETEGELAEDIHWRLMKRYTEVPEWWYLIVLLIALGVGIAGLEAYPTYVTPAVVPYGILMALLFMVPIGLIYAVTGQQVTLNVIAEFIGASIVPGDALAMNYFKMYGYITAAHALAFSKDLKLAHYTKIPPRHTFWCQLVATFVSCFVCTSLFNFLLGFKGICTSEASFNMSCPGINTFFTASVFWGTYGPLKLFGPNGHYKKLLIGFPVGFILPIITFYASKFIKSRHIRALHPVAICFGGLMWAPYNMSMHLPGLIITYISWAIIKPRYLAFWARYNYILYSAFTTGVAVSAIIIFFALQIPGKEVVWWGNNVPFEGCDQKGCRRLEIPEVGYFGPAPGTFK